jgi:3-oxoacyl-[acyl-carrier-protein] synthase-1
MRLAIFAAGLLTPVGFNYRASCAAIRAGLSGIGTANLWDSESGEFLLAGKVQLPQWWEGLTKLPELLAPVIHECHMASPINPREIPILLGVASSNRPQLPPDLRNQLFEALHRKLNLTPHPLSRVIDCDQVSAVAAVIEAKRLLSSGESRYCIIAGVDSFLDQKTVESYLERRRLLTRLNSNGFIPGEAAGAVLIRASETDRDVGARIIGVGLAQEPATIESDQPLRATGLTEAVRIALEEARVSIHEITHRLTDLNGEHYKFKEANFVLNRLREKKVENADEIWHPTECIGEVGAAIGPCLMALALHSAEKGYAPGHLVLCHFSNDNGQRGAMVLQLTPGKED